jgi:hypothetical protein
MSCREISKKHGLTDHSTSDDLAKDNTLDIDKKDIEDKSNISNVPKVKTIDLELKYHNLTCSQVALDGIPILLPLLRKIIIIFSKKTD